MGIITESEDQTSTRAGRARGGSKCAIQTARSPTERTDDRRDKLVELCVDSPCVVLFPSSITAFCRLVLHFVSVKQRKTMRKGKVMRPFRPPRQSVEKKSVCRASDSAEPTEFGLVRGSWIVKETQELGYETTKDHIETILGNVEVLPNQNLEKLRFPYEKLRSK